MHNVAYLGPANRTLEQEQRMEDGGQSAAASGAFSKAQMEAVECAISTHQHRPGALLPMLHTVQDALGFVPTQAVPLIAQALNLSRAEVHGVVSFYHDFRSHPPGRHVLRLCRAEACQSMGAERIAELAQRETGIGFGGTTGDGGLTLEAVYCLGNCACAPAAMLDGEVHGRLDETSVHTLLRGLGATR
jgi:formate dehydrogenase subunit gamma